MIFQHDASTPRGSSIGLADFLATFWDRWQTSGFYFLFVACAVGTFTGMLVSRNLTRRLRRITNAVHSWSQGRFRIEVRDDAHDEIGKLAQNLNSMVEQLQALLAARRELAVMEERRRLERDLHDVIKQQLFATQMQIAAARVIVEDRPEDACGYLMDAEHLAKTAQQELTMLIQELRPQALLDKHLIPVIEEYCAAWSRRTGIAAELGME